MTETLSIISWLAEHFSFSSSAECDKLSCVHSFATLLTWIANSVITPSVIAGFFAFSAWFTKEGLSWLENAISKKEQMITVLDSLELESRDTLKHIEETLGFKRPGENQTETDPESYKYSASWKEQERTFSSAKSGFNLDYTPFCIQPPPSFIIPYVKKDFEKIPQELSGFILNFIQLDETIDQILASFSKAEFKNLTLERKQAACQLLYLTYYNQANAALVLHSPLIKKIADLKADLSNFESTRTFARITMGILFSLPIFIGVLLILTRI